MTAEWKLNLIKQIEELSKEYPVIGVLDMTNLPLAQLQDMRANLSGSVKIIGGRKKLFKLGLHNASKNKHGLEKLNDKMQGLPALLFAKDNPFKLYKTLQKSKTDAPARAGSIAPRDIIVPAGKTSFAPGPVIGELGSVGIKAGIDAGKVAIKQDSLVAKQGDVINDKLAGILTRLGIRPMEIGLNLVAVYENGSVFDKSVLLVDEKEYIGNITKAATWAFNLAMNEGLLTSETTELLIQKTYNDSKALAREQNIMADAVIPELLAKAEREMLAVKQKTE